MSKRRRPETGNDYYDAITRLNQPGVSAVDQGNGVFKVTNKHKQGSVGIKHNGEAIPKKQRNFIDAMLRMIGVYLIFPSASGVLIAIIIILATIL